MTGPVPRPIERIEGADALRGIAACAVVLHHLIHVLKLETAPWMAPIASHFGLGVPLFYVISAFAMYHVYFYQHSEPTFVIKFMVRRYARLLPLYLTMFIVIAVASYLVFRAPLAFELWHLPIYLSLTFALIPKMAGGYVYASWSIGVEMLFYLMFPVMVACIRTIPSAVAGLVVAIFISLGSQASIDMAKLPNPYYVAINPVLFLPCFFAGALVWLARGEKRRSHYLGADFLAVLCLLGLVAAYFCAPPPGIALGATGHYWFKVNGFMLAFVALVYSQATNPSRLLVNRLTMALGRLSYGIYLLHTFVILFVVRLAVLKIGAIFPGQPTLVFLLATVLTFAILLPLAELAYRFVEAPGIRLGGRIAKWIDARHAAEAAAQWSEMGPVARAKDDGRDKPVSQSSET